MFYAEKPSLSVKLVSRSEQYVIEVNGGKIVRHALLEHIPLQFASFFSYGKNRPI
jgi:hypothetical protein